jgi:predicted metalloprotease with PDZ domain
MQFDDNENPSKHPENRAQEHEHGQVSDAPTPQQAPLQQAPLRREAVFKSNDGHRGALIAACCSLAGVGVGFGLSQMAVNASNCHENRLAVSHARSALPAPLPRAAVTWLGAEVRSSCGAQPGAHVADIVPGSPAEIAGLEVGDVIVSLAGKEIRTSRELVRAVREQPVGRTVSVGTINVQGEHRQTPVSLGGITPRELRNLAR